jgi:hypothetical protein
VGVKRTKTPHVAAALDQRRRVLGTESFPATTAGYRQLWRCVNSFGSVEGVGVEGTGAWGEGSRFSRRSRQR